MFHTTFKFDGLENINDTVHVIAHSKKNNSRYGIKLYGY